MAHAISRGKDGRRREIDFGDAALRVEFFSTEAVVETVVTADCESLPEAKRRFVLLNLPRSAFSAALGAAAREGTGPRRRDT